ncbi:MAG: SpoVR family protein [Pseudomonadota bacterium]
MELINQHTKRIMEGCKARAREAGLCFQDETLEYIVTNRDLLELSPKYMIPTLYDYWVHDIEVLNEKGRYELYPHNPYETVINTRPPISFYNDNNPDWLNLMIFYHVLGHIDFFQNNMLFKNTWDEDFTGQALSDKRMIAALRSEKGRWVDYVVEFTRGIDNLVGFFSELSESNHPAETKTSDRLDFYFDTFLQAVKRVKAQKYRKEIERYNEAVATFGDMAEAAFFSDITKKYPEFEAFFEKRTRSKKRRPTDLIQYLQDHSPFLRQEENRWMTSVMEIVRKTSLFFQPQIRTKILNEGWASYWHDSLFLQDDRIRGHEVDYARVNAKVTALPRVGINPYALGMKLFETLREGADKGKMSIDFQRIKTALERKTFDRGEGKGLDFLFKVRENFGDFMFINTFVDQDFVDKYRLFVAGKKLNREKGVWEYFVKSRKAEDYRRMLLDSLYHPPHIEVDEARTDKKCLYLNHHFEEKPLVRDFIPNTMMGIEYIWGGTVKLETSEKVREEQQADPAVLYQYPSYPQKEKQTDSQPQYRRVLYNMENKKLSKAVL